MLLNDSNFVQSKIRYSGTTTFDHSAWFSMIKILRQQDVDRHAVMIWLSTATFLGADPKILQTLALCFNGHDGVLMDAPGIAEYRPSSGFEKSNHVIEGRIRESLVDISSTPEGQLQPGSFEKYKSFRKRRQRIYDLRVALVTKQLASLFAAQWPTAAPRLPEVDPSTSSIATYIDVQSAHVRVRELFETWHANLRLWGYFGNIAQFLRSISRNVSDSSAPEQLLSFSKTDLEPQIRSCLSTAELFLGPVRSQSDPPMLCTDHIATRTAASSPSLDKSTSLEALVTELSNPEQSPYQSKYASDLQRSLKSLEHFKTHSTVELGGPTLLTVLEDHFQACRAHLEKVYAELCNQAKVNVSLSNGHVLYYAPRFSSIILLQQLHPLALGSLPRSWRLAITQYAMAHTAVQKAQRLLRAAKVDRSYLLTEYRNQGHTNWQPGDNTEALLLEIESNITIREVQIDIANEMRACDGQNAVMQLNMGEGKSSVIVPLIVIASATGDRLARVIVAKPQSKQMAQMLISKLGGLLNKQVFYMPFSRALKLNEAGARSIDAMCRKCMEQRGVLLVQPEHILSLQLMGIECLDGKRDDVGISLLRVQKFFDSCSRDVVDESDENFSVKFELVYTVGMQQQAEMGSMRWTFIQQLLSLVKKYASIVANAHPTAIEIGRRDAGRFPRVRLLKNDGTTALLAHISQHISDFGITGFPLSTQTREIRAAIMKYITQPHVDRDEIRSVETSGLWTRDIKNVILLLRGMLAGGVLAFALGQKRWRVNYGLDNHRTPSTRLAVPYRAKDNPSARSEFSHPDVIVILTSLSYYYAGLTNENLFLTFDHLIKSDQATVEYQAWVADSPTLPGVFRQLEGVNLQDQSQCTADIFPHMRFAKAAIDYFLNLVFTKELKEFPEKLSASGWDLGKEKTNPTTGFSGTNDSKHLLPIDIQNRDLERQVHTNAKVLDFLLRAETTIA
jgi:hypothetical protein